MMRCRSLGIDSNWCCRSLAYLLVWCAMSIYCAGKCLGGNGDLSGACSCIRIAGAVGSLYAVVGCRE